jgi:hypothetical protein
MAAEPVAEASAHRPMLPTCLCSPAERTDPRLTASIALLRFESGNVPGLDDALHTADELLATRGWNRVVTR